MSNWTSKVLEVLTEYKDKEGYLKHKWEIVQTVNEESGKHFRPCLQKTGYYQKNGEETRGYPQGLSLYDLDWVRDNWRRIRDALDPVPAEDDNKNSAPPKSAKEIIKERQAEKNPQAGIEDAPF